MGGKLGTESAMRLRVGSLRKDKDARASRMAFGQNEVIDHISTHLSTSRSQVTAYTPFLFVLVEFKDDIEQGLGYAFIKRTFLQIRMIRHQRSCLQSVI